MNDHREPAEQLGHASAEQTAATYGIGVPPAPLPPALVSAILRDPDSPYYPSKIVVFCDECGAEDARDYMVSTQQTSAERLEVARRHLRADGWQCDATGDFCPDHRTPPSALVLAEVAYERVRQDQRWGEQNHPDGTGYEGSARHADFWRERCQNAFADGAGTWGHVLLEEVFEAIAENDPAELRAELLQVAAVAVAWIEAIDRRQATVAQAIGHATVQETSNTYEAQQRPTAGLTVESLARLLAGGAGLTDAAPPYDQLPVADRERFLGQALQLLARADGGQQS